MEIRVKLSIISAHFTCSFHSQSRNGCSERTANRSRYMTDKKSANEASPKL